MSGEPVVTVSLLGDVTVMVDGVPVDAGGPKPRAMLAQLAMSPGRPVSAARVSAGLWGDEPPETADATLRSYASRLRKLLGIEVLRREPAGYVLDVPPAAVDAVVFREAVARALEQGARPDRAEAAEQALAEALGLWHGRALQDLRELPAVLEQRRVLEQIRLEAWEALVELRLQRGAHGRALRDLQPLLDEHPTRERLHGQRMLALYRAGRQSEALEAFATLRRQMSADLGIAPGPALQQLHAQMLAQDPALLGPAAPERVRPQPAGLAAVARLIGRDEDVGRLLQLLSSDRLVTVTGPGGAGKTRLALEVARRLVAEVPTVVVVELAGVSEPTGVVAALADALGPAVAAEASLRGIAGALGNAPVLLVLDNCEHVRAAAAEVASGLLVLCPDLRVLATSRHVLGVPGELAVELAPLSVGDGARQPGAAELLFLDRARAAAGGHVDHAPDDLAVVADICRQLDGLPLAIELAAAQTRLLSLPEVRDRLHDRFRFLSPPTLSPTTGRGLLGAVAWSVESLDDVQGAAFTAVSVFACPFTLDAAQAVIGDDLDAVPILSQLVERSLLSVDRTSRPRRYRLLETLRQYAQQQPEARAAVLEQARDAHARFFTDLAVRLSATLRDPDSAPAWERLVRESNDVRTALTWWLSRGDGRQALRLATAMSWFWYRRGHVGEAQQALEQALELALAAGASVPDEPDRARALVALGSLATLTGRADGVLERFAEGCALAEQAGDVITQASGLAWAGFVRALTGDGTRARRDLDQALRLAGEAGAGWVEAEGYIALGVLNRAEGEAEAAAGVLRLAERRSVEAGHAWSAACAAWLAGTVCVDQGDGDGAYDALRRSLEYAEADVSSTLIGLQSIAGALALRGDASAGAQILGCVEAASRDAGFDPGRIGAVHRVRSLSLVTERLAADELSRAWAHGRSLTPAEAVQLALESGSAA